jgi:hypothetical protein
MRTRTVLIAAVAVLVGLGAFALWFTGRESLDAVDIDRAVADAQAATSGDGSGEEAAGAPALTDATGTWSVDLDAVPFDRASGGGTWVGYRIDEELTGVGPFTAVGLSPRVEGTVTIDGSVVTTAEIRADLEGLVSDNPNRDGRVRPILRDRPVSFTLLEPVDFGAIPSEGQRVVTDARGVLRVGDVEQEVRFELAADVVGQLLIVTGSTVVLLEDIDVRVPSAPVVLSVSDEVTIELQLYLSRD